MKVRTKLCGKRIQVSVFYVMALFLICLYALGLGTAEFVNATFAADVLRIVYSSIVMIVAGKWVLKYWRLIYQIF